MHNVVLVQVLQLAEHCNEQTPFFNAYPGEQARQAEDVQDTQLLAQFAQIPELT